MKHILGMSLAALAIAGCTTVDKYHEGPVDPQLGLDDCSSNPYAIDYRIEPERKIGEGHSECWFWFFSSSDGRHMSPPGITFDAGLKAAKEAATYDVVEKAVADALVGALYKYDNTSKWWGIYKCVDCKVIGFPAHVEKVTQLTDRPVVISKDQQLIRVRMGEKIENQCTAPAEKTSSFTSIKF